MKFILSGKVIIIHLIAGLIKKNSLYKMSYLPEHNSHSKKEDKRELDFCLYTTKSDLKSATCIINTSKSAKNGDRC